MGLGMEKIDPDLLENGQRRVLDLLEPLLAEDLDRREQVFDLTPCVPPV
jgi:hypothetical protein